MKIIFCILIPFFGTILGSATVFLMKNKISNIVEKFLLGFASGVMIAASIWSLIIPSIDMAKNQHLIAWLPASIGFFIGIIILILIDKIVNSLKSKANKEKKNMMILAITLHNIPEGMAVGVAVMGAIMGNVGITLTSALILSIGIGIQNIPEGAIISLPLKSKGVSKTKSFTYGVLSGIVEPIGAILTILITNFIMYVLPYLLSFAAGAMIYVVIEELVPEFKENTSSKIGILGVSIGFLLMMILDVSLS